MQNKKCQKCKLGYFKTRNELCIYCNSDNAGGPGCYECGYESEKSDNIICKSCYPYYHQVFPDRNYNPDIYEYRYSDSIKTILSSKNKCYFCETIFGSACNACEFRKNAQGIENLVCTSCLAGFYITTEGYCVQFISIIPTKENCFRYQVWADHKSYYDIRFDRHEIGVYIGGSGYSPTEYRVLNNNIHSICYGCKNNYDENYLENEYGRCEELNYDNCSFKSLITQKRNKLLENCRLYCNDNKNALIIIPIIMEGKIIEEININTLSLYSLDKNFTDIIQNEITPNEHKTCLYNSGKGEENSPYSLRNCKEAYYFSNNNTYICKKCLNNYILSYNNLCYESNGNDIGFTLVKLENGQVEYTRQIEDLEGCIEADGVKFYAKGKYNCTKCSVGYRTYFSKFFGGWICQNTNEDPITEKQISYDIFNNIFDRVQANNGLCEKSYMFTPDGKYCYRCDDEIVGMPGCNGACTFSLKRNQTIICKGTCKKGYIESSEGVCSPCSSIKKDCYDCHYENINEKNRKFVCDICEGNKLNPDLDLCLDCYNLGLKNCKKCDVHPFYKDEYICTECEKNYYINEFGKCDTCGNDKLNFLRKKGNKNICTPCHDYLNEGIDKCWFCESKDDNTNCIRCSDGHILLKNNNTCLRRALNIELEKFVNCYEVTLINNEYVCTRCSGEYALIKTKDGKSKCIYIPQFYNNFFLFNYAYDFYTKTSRMQNQLAKSAENDYIFNKYKYYYPCKEVVNLGTENNPLYSCIECHEELFYIENRKYKPIKITDERTKLSYCIEDRAHDTIKNCKEATYKRKDGEDIYSCTKCIENYELKLNEKNNLYTCKEIIEDKGRAQCLILYCEVCDYYNGYLCNECSENYALNTASGACVEKTKVVPAVTWKDICRLILNGEKIINYQTYYGPLLELRGITNDQINSRHAFIIYLIFEIYNGLRSLEEEEKIEIPAICQIKNQVDRKIDDVSMVEYECIGNSTVKQDIDLSNYKLKNIEERENKELKKTNFDELVSKIDLDLLQNKIEPEFTYEDLLKIINFNTKNKTEKIESYGYNYSFEIEGILNKEMPENITEIELEVEEIDDKIKCLFKVGQNKLANISCDINLENHKDINSISFRTLQVNIGDYEVNIGAINNIEIIHLVKEIITTNINKNIHTTYLHTTYVNNNNDNIINSEYNNNDDEEKNKGNDKKEDNNNKSDNEDNNDKENENIIKDTENINNGENKNLFNENIIKEDNNDNDGKNNENKNDVAKVSLKILLSMLIIITFIIILIILCQYRKKCSKAHEEKKPYVRTTEDKYTKYSSDMSDQRFKKKKNNNHKVINN